jgi:hypothetical protein
MAQQQQQVTRSEQQQKLDAVKAKRPPGHNGAPSPSGGKTYGTWPRQSR